MQVELTSVDETKFQVYEQDGLPNMICHPCKYQLEKSYQFRKKCQAADTKLRKHMKLIQQLTGQDEEGGESHDSNRDDLKETSAGKSKQVKQLLADLVSTKGESDETDGNPIEVTEEELVGGYILGTILLLSNILKCIFLYNFCINAFLVASLRRDEF